MLTWSTLVNVVVSAMSCWSYQASSPAPVSAGMRRPPGGTQPVNSIRLTPRSSVRTATIVERTGSVAASVLRASAALAGGASNGVPLAGFVEVVRGTMTTVRRCR